MDCLLRLGWKHLEHQQTWSSDKHCLLGIHFQNNHFDLCLSKSIEFTAWKTLGKNYKNLENIIDTVLLNSTFLKLVNHWMFIPNNEINWKKWNFSRAVLKPHNHKSHRGLLDNFACGCVEIERNENCDLKTIVSLTCCMENVWTLKMDNWIGNKK